jgi:hypothetical protein
MTTQQPALHVLLWHDATANPGAGPMCGPMWGWQQFHSHSGGLFQKHGDHGWIGVMAKRVLCDDFGAMIRGIDVTIAWQPERPSGRSAESLEPVFREMRPLTLICPARPRGSDWAVFTYGSPQIIAASSVQRVVDEMVPSMFPQWQPGVRFQPQGFMLRRGVSAEELQLLPPVKISPDDTYASVADDPAVIAAGKLWDRATPSTHRNLVAAVLAAQERAGVPVGDRAPLQSGAVDDYLMPLLFRVGRDDEGPLLNHMRRDLRRRYGEFAEIVLLFMLRTYRHGGTDKLLALATKKEAA